MGRQQRRQRDRRAQQRADQRATQRASSKKSSGTSGIGMGTIAIGVAVLLVVIAALAYEGTHQTASSPTATPLMGTPPPSSSVLPAVDGVQCNAGENLVYHIHQHLALYDHGRQVQVPSEIGIPGGELNPTCFYWIHVHVATPNIIHVESPLHKTFDLGNFFDIWKATKDTTIPAGDAYVTKLEAAAAKGQVTSFYNGKRWTGSYRAIPLTAHAVITVEIGKPVVPPQPFTAWNGL